MCITIYRCLTSHVIVDPSRYDDDDEIHESRKKTKTKKAAINKQVGSVPLTAKNTS